MADSWRYLLEGFKEAKEALSKNFLLPFYAN